MRFTTGTLNVACAGRDEKTCPLATRLASLGALLRAHPVDILCLQEIRPTQGLSPAHVMNYLTQALQDATGKEYTYDMIPTNSSGLGCFSRAVIYTTANLQLKERYFYPVDNVVEKQFGYALVRYSFENKNTGEAFDVINAHAPMRKIERLAYWTLVATLLRTATVNTVCVGDFNKFQEERDDYNVIFADAVDLIAPETITFVSFPSDTQADGSLWRSSLDSVLLASHHQKQVQANVTVISTETLYNGMRPTDHFYLTVDVMTATA